jgi:hypothetical protein
MFVLRFLSRHWGKLLLVLFALWFFEIHPIDDTVELLGFNSGRMVDVQQSGRLAPFPLERSHLKVTETSGMFSHVVKIYFVATPEVISRWMKDSPGIQDAKPYETSSRTTAYPLWGEHRGAGIVYISDDKTEVGVNLGQALDGPTSTSPIPPRH